MCFLLRVFSNKEKLYRHCFSNFASEFRVQEKRDGLKLNGTYLLVYADDVNVFCGRLHTLENNKNEEFIYLGTTLTNPNSIQEEIKGKLKSGNAYYHTVQNLLSSSFLSKHL